MKKRIGTLKGRPIVEGDENLVRNPEYKDTNIFDTGYYYKIIDKENFIALFNNFAKLFSGYGFKKEYVGKLLKEVNIIYNFNDEINLDYIYISDKSNLIKRDDKGNIAYITKLNKGLQYIIDILIAGGEGTKGFLKTFKNSFIQITKSEFNKAYLEYEP